jgi:hypothetical protein
MENKCPGCEMVKKNTGGKITECMAHITLRLLKERGIVVKTYENKESVEILENRNVENKMRKNI